METGITEDVDRADELSLIAEQITRSILEQAFVVAERCGARAILVYADALPKDLSPIVAEAPCPMIRLVKSAEEVAAEDSTTPRIRVADVNLTRMGQAKVGLFCALARGLVGGGDVVVCLAGAPASGTLDNLLVARVGHDSEMVTFHPAGLLPPGVEADVVERVVEIACELGESGREAKPVGCLFVIGDTDQVLGRSRQLILNPFHGYTVEQRNLLLSDLDETVKELATVDGAFIIRGNGVIETCGAHLHASDSPACDLPHGLGTRHHVAAEISSLTESIAIAVSESTGAVTLFRGGKIVTTIKRPRSAA